MIEHKGDWMQTFTGKAFWPLDPRRTEVDPVDIAHSLAQQVRFAGHTPEPYTIAQHSVLVSKRAEELATAGALRGVIEIAQWGLLHDATEAYLVDVPRPVKRSLPEYQEIERNLAAAIWCRFVAPENSTWSMRAYPHVERADNEILSAEAAVFFPARERPRDWGELPLCPPQYEPWTIWSHDRAEVEFLRRFIQLGLR
jgi:hypothetical protein